MTNILITTNYPRLTTHFLTSIPLPEFVIPCSTRNDIIRNHLKHFPYLLNQIPHVPDDFTVRKVIRGADTNDEIWYLGS